jgi:hypothetical protein
VGALVHDLTEQVSTLVRDESNATPALPEEAIEGIKEDVNTAKGEPSHDHTR